MAGKRLYERVLHLITQQHREEIAKLSEQFGISANAVVRSALDIGLPILSKLPIDIRHSRGMMDTVPNETTREDDEDGNP